EEGQTTGARQKTGLFGFSFARRLTRLISVPTANFAPAGAAAIVFAMNSVEPLRSAACTVSNRHSGWTMTVVSGYFARASAICWGVKRWGTEQWPAQGVTRLRCSASSVL